MTRYKQLKQYGANETHDGLDLYHKLKSLHFQRGFDQQRFVNNFDSLISNFRDHDIHLDESFVRLRIMFLAKIDGIKDHGFPTSTFYNSMCIQEKKNRTYDFAKQQFLNLDLPREKFSHSKDFNSNPRRKDNSYKRQTHNENRHSRPSCSDHNDFRPPFNDPRPANRFDHMRKRPNKDRSDEPNKRAKYQPSYNSNSSRSSHPSSTAPDGQYYVKGILVIPGTKPIYPDELAQKIKRMTPEELQCDTCGQYNHDDSQCRAPGKQCYRCYNYGHTGNICPINPQKNN